MSEVQKILDNFDGCGQEDCPGYNSGNVQALYDLLMEKMPKRKNEYAVPPRRTGEDGSGFVEGVPDRDAIAHNNAVDEMVSAINELFGRTE